MTVLLVSVKQVVLQAGPGLTATHVSILFLKNTKNFVGVL